MLIVSGVNRTIFFDRIEHTPGLLHKIKFYCVYGKVLWLCFFSEMFLSSRRLWLVWKNKSSSKCAINSGKCQNYILIYLFFSILIVSRMMFCVRLLSKLVILLSTHHVVKHPTCRSKLAFESKFDTKNQNCWKIFLFSISYFLTLKRQDLVLKVIYLLLKLF